MRLNLGTTTKPLGRIKGWRYSEPSAIKTVKEVLAYNPELKPKLEAKIIQKLAEAKETFDKWDKELYGVDSKGNLKCPRGSYYGDKVSAKWWYYQRKIDTLNEALNLLKGRKG